MPTKRPVKAEADVLSQLKSSGLGKPKPGSATSDKENEKVKKEKARIDAMDLSDIDSPEWEIAKQQHAQLSQKRQRDVEAIEDVKRKVSAKQCCDELPTQANIVTSASSHSNV